MNFSGLSLDQAPPISAPLRFFLTAPLFGMAAALLLFFGEMALFESRYAVETIVVVHLITIGVFGMVMVGALQQMLPVLAGVALPKAKASAALSHAAISLGLICMSIGLWQGVGALSLAASLLLGGGFLVILGAVAMAMKKVSYYTPTTKAMRLSLLFALLVVLLGMHLLASHGIGKLGSIHLRFTDIHSTWGIFGFAGILIIGVAFQILPMFYVTPGFKKFCKKYVVNLIALGLLVWGVFAFVSPELMWLGKVILFLFFLAFAIVIQLKLSRRRRPVSDVTVWYWRTGGASLLVGLFVWLGAEVTEYDLTAAVAILIGGGFILSIISGMLYKIIPFLAWFHLNGSGYFTIPTMREFIDERLARLQYGLHLLTLLLFIAALWQPLLFKAGALSMLLSFAVLEYNLLKVMLTYAEIKKKPPEFSMTMDAA